MKAGDLAVVDPEELEESFRDYYILWDDWNISTTNARYVGMVSVDDMCIVLELSDGIKPPGARVFTSKGYVGWLNEGLLRVLR